MSNCSRDVELNACNVQNSPPNKCIPRILYMSELSKRKHNKQKRIILCNKGKTTHIESIAYLGIKKIKWNG